MPRYNTEQYHAGCDQKENQSGGNHRLPFLEPVLASFSFFFLSFSNSFFSFSFCFFKSFSLSLILSRSFLLMTPSCFRRGESRVRRTSPSTEESRNLGMYISMDSASNQFATWRRDNIIFNTLFSGGDGIAVLNNL